MKFSVQTDRTLIRDAGSSRRYALASIVAPTAPPRDQRAPVNVAFVLDRSGSMADERKFTLAREAVERALRMLRPEDRFALVVYDDRIDVVKGLTKATPKAIALAQAMLTGIEPRGGTDLGAGWGTGCEQLLTVLEDKAITRCLLLSDGLANHGITERHQLARVSAEFRRKGVVTSTFGVGADFDEHLLRDISHASGGNAWFIEAASQIPEILTTELGEALEVTVKSASLRITTPVGTSAKPLNNFRFTTSRDRQECLIDLGDLVSGQVLDVAVQLSFPKGEWGEKVTAQFELVTPDLELSLFPLELSWTFETHQANDHQSRVVEVDRAVAAQFATRARAEATEFNRRGEFDRARQVIERTARRIDSYAGDDRELRELASALRREMGMYVAEAMSPMELKMSFYLSEASSKGRDRFGRARR
jgi:Ca-activated chloride channel family protein